MPLNCVQRLVYRETVSQADKLLQILPVLALSISVFSNATRLAGTNLRLLERAQPGNLARHQHVGFCQSPAPAEFPISAVIATPCKFQTSLLFLPDSKNHHQLFINHRPWWVECRNHLCNALFLACLYLFAPVIQSFAHCLSPVSDF